MSEKDICISMPEGEFKLRSAALIINDGKLLLVHHSDFPGYFTIGGKVLYGETSIKTAERETYEETGICLKAERLVFVNERIFEEHHEIVFFYLMAGNTGEIKDGDNTEKKAEQMFWIPIEQLCDYDINPPFLKDELKSIPNKVKHIISFS